MADRTPPTPMAILISTAILAALSGYMLGVFSSLGFLPIPFAPTTAAKPRGIENYDDEEESEEEDIDDSTLDHAPNWVNGLEADKRDGLSIGAAAAKDNVGEKEKERTEKDKAWDESSSTEECKLVLVVRTDLGMTKGKIAAQCGHATLACYKTSLKLKSPILKRWEHTGQAKIAVQTKSEEEMMELRRKARELGIVAEVIADAGRTQIASGSHTVLGIGPAPKSVVDRVSGGLKLL
ncbi:hypothetical protein B7494_g2552 [Chlorociboria aeruginascens]|nr:hypothetical protein B7494_g2552 [Chlorociboria aeruginascens]